MKNTKEIINFTMTYKSAAIAATYTFENEDENGTLEFQNPVSGSSNEDIDTVLQGWSEQNESENEEWAKLVELAKDFCDSELYWKIDNDGSYNLEELV